ncbi:uncharacterized protein EHS24_003630 [Apiotrichum porosum]|uniref:Tse2 ADP-ribosyltransferase toxin domain-containing protein n=1 Tax=Apiotrichum porosum TaxID=105984 RepID=A0A427XEH8_9TREE|nr:uncharacterized protein EHS24_003630 [Apiotrichum porosum]RSH77319.1 hypothetical protein EHS24_003630 [Apiotrichum porosum]
MTLFRIQPRLPATLRSHADQMAKGRTSFDLKLRRDGLVHPMPVGASYTTPNGMSLRPIGPNMDRILRNYPGSPMVYGLQEGSRLPEDLCVVHERGDHYSLQTTRPVTLAQLNTTMTAFLESLPYQTAAQFLEWREDEDDQDN